jgi:hypothetical protein
VTEHEPRRSVSRAAPKKTAIAKNRKGEPDKENPISILNRGKCG